MGKDIYKYIKNVCPQTAAGNLIFSHHPEPIKGNVISNFHMFASLEFAKYLLEKRGTKNEKLQFLDDVFEEINKFITNE